VTTFAFSGEIVDNRSAGARDSTYRLHYTVLNDLQTEVARGDTTVIRVGSRTPFLIRPVLGLLEPGSYRVVVELSKPLPSGGGRKKPIPIRREKPFTIEQSTSSLTLDPKAAIEVIRYIASDAEASEMDRLKAPEERRAFWDSFWKRRDPTPDTPQNEAMDEFYRRVQYANQHFSTAGPGWKTDMGRIYIIYGQPDEVVRNPFRFEGPPEEIWYYYRERKTYYFVDKDGFGRYELDTARNSQ
jgi:GWxTD domain-containing protein